MNRRTVFLAIIAFLAICLSSLTFYLFFGKTNQTINIPSVLKHDAADSALKQKDSITIQDDAFSPAILSINITDAITWTNNTNQGQTLVFADGIESQNILPHATYTRKFSIAGNVPYHTKLAPSKIQGIIQVIDPTKPSNIKKAG